MRFSLPGVKVPHKKNTAASVPLRLTAIEGSEVTIPMSMHIGRPASPVVKVGDKVFVGTVIGTADAPVSSPVYSSVSGEVTKITEILTPAGKRAEAVVIRSDGEMAGDPALSAPGVNSREELIAAIRDSGVVGLGGAGFPTHVKFTVPEQAKISELIINAAECEPYITSDMRTMVDRAEDIGYALNKLSEYFDFDRIIIGIEKNKPDAIEKMREIAAANAKISVKVLPSMYPQGGEKVLVYNTTGKVIPAGKLPLHVGCIVTNCTTVAVIGSYLKTGMPLVEKCVTVDGSAVKEPKNVIAPIGMPISELFEAAGGFIEEPKKVLLGGPMMGIAAPSTSVPVTKTVNAVLALTAKEAKPKKETACIRCGTCADHCPVNLTPYALYKAYRADNMAELERLRVDICMECGSCSYVCPAAKPLTETHRLSKTALREYQEENKNKEVAGK